MFVEALLEAARLCGGKEAVRDPLRRLTYRQLRNVAATLRSFVMDATDRRHVGILMPGSGAFVGTFYGTLWADRVAVPLNFLLSAEELAEIVRDADLDVVFSIHHFDPLTSQLPVRTICLEDLPLKRRVLTGMLRRRPAPPRIDPAAMAVLLYTSGTSGVCKGVELSYRNLYSNSVSVIEAADLQDDDRFLCVLPPFHVFGLTGNVLLPVVRRLSVHYIPRFSPASVLKAMEESRPRVLMAIPSMYNALLRAKSAGAEAFASLRLPISGGEPLSSSVARRFREKFHKDILEGYGLTETAPVISLNTPNRHRAGSVGVPLADVTVRIVDDNGASLATGADGEIQVKGSGVMRGYHHRPEETASVLDSAGWFATGDIGHLDEDGFLFITGRKKEMMIVGGENVFPGEIEAVLLNHPSVDEAAVIGAPDESRGEVPMAWVTLKDGAEISELELRSHAKGSLAGYKIPRQVRIVEDFPRGPTGKILKRKLRDWLDSAPGRN